jgi:hypothetical protein
MLLIAALDVGFDAHSGLPPDIAPCPKSANIGHQPTSIRSTHQPAEGRAQFI